MCNFNLGRRRESFQLLPAGCFANYSRWHPFNSIAVEVGRVISKEPHLQFPLPPFEVRIAPFEVGMTRPHPFFPLVGIGSGSLFPISVKWWCDCGARVVVLCCCCTISWCRFWWALLISSWESSDCGTLWVAPGFWFPPAASQMQ